MEIRYLSRWQKKRKLLVAIGIIVAFALGIALIVGIIGGYLFHWGWTGTTTKTLWDWLNLLGVLAIPVVVGFGVAWFTIRQGKVTDAENKDNQRETALQAYIDNMSELLLHEKLRGSAGEDEVRSIARARTLTILDRLDGGRKGSLINFLYESKLILREQSIIDLHDANLNNANLWNANLSNADLSGAFLMDAFLGPANLSHAKLIGTRFYNANLGATNMSGADLSNAAMSSSHLKFANLRDATLTAAYMREADLTGAELNDADLRMVNLRGAKISSTNFSGAILIGVIGFTNEELEKQAKSLKGTTMPDGTIHL
jgi:hypothetical protein